MRQLVDNVIVLSTGRAESIEAFVLKSTHADFENNLLVATALHANIDIFVSNDAELVKHAPVACLTSSDAVHLLESERAGL